MILYKIYLTEEEKKWFKEFFDYILNYTMVGKLKTEADLLRKKRFESMSKALQLAKKADF